ncbi:MAG: hypothetical protein KZQ94_07365 [Candidatus Thiodiazotropha sp. (ex Troendleina suluensis)]|nr:hypothetical protein [Candidatus Thiodiazotropha sp. (ex Troendleina suluensis)]
MIEDARINYFRIVEAGYYTHRKHELMFGSAASVFQDLMNWVKDGEITLAATKTFEIEEGDDFGNTFCFDIENNIDTGDFVLTTWNETPNVEGNVAAVSANSKVGQADVEMIEVSEDRIPGFATYFWFAPSHSLLATIRFQHNLNGHRALVKYINEFMAKFSCYAVVDEDDEEVEHAVIGYQENDESEIINLNPLFKSVVLRKAGKIEFIKENRNRIRKMIRKNLLSPKVQDTKGLFDRFMINLGLQQAPQLVADIKAKYEVSYNPDEEELERIINRWEESHETKWDDVGFKMERDKGTHWLSHSLIKYDLKLDVERENLEVVNSASLLNAITENRNALLGLAV